MYVLLKPSACMDLITDESRRITLNAVLFACTIDDGECFLTLF